MRLSFTQWTAIFTYSLAGVIAHSIRANPLPAPHRIIWDTFDPIEIDKSLRISINAPIEIVEDAFNRLIDSIWRVKWQPATWEAPIEHYHTDPAKLMERRNVRRRKLHQSLIRNKIISELRIEIKNLDASLQMGVDESYTFEVKPNSSTINISAETQWGALHALTTLGQIVFHEKELDKFYIELSVSINDWPLYPHRGVLIDTGRNFLTVESILDHIDIMALSKMNVLHWHLMDSQSWPIKLYIYPEMTKDASFADEIYTKLDITYVISYAKRRGVRVIPEFEVPGHSRAGYLALNKSVLACENSWWSNDVGLDYTAVEPPPGQLEILNDETYEVVEGIYGELSEMFEDHIFHVGGDELQINCYNFSTVTQDWFAANSSRTFEDLVQYWVDKAIPIFERVKDRKLMMWEDILTSQGRAHKIPQNVIIQAWATDNKHVQSLTEKGYDVVVSTNNFLYLDCGYGGWVTNDPRYVQTASNNPFNLGLGGSWCGPYKTWQRIYNFNITANLTEEQLQHILGGEAALWSEQVDSVVLIQKIWPRTAALAEILWSGNADPNTGHLRTTWMTLRILNFREYLLASGYLVSPLVPRFCLHNPHACDLYKNQSILNSYS